MQNSVAYTSILMEQVQSIYVLQCSKFNKDILYVLQCIKYMYRNVTNCNMYINENVTRVTNQLVKTQQMQCMKRMPHSKHNNRHLGNRQQIFGHGERVLQEKKVSNG